MGRCDWLIGKHKKALKNWRRGIQEGVRLGAKLELSRAYREIGCRLREEKSRHAGLDGMSAMEYLEKARSMFKDMDLAWDLGQLEKEQPGPE
jgi:hypothetical protein